MVRAGGDYASADSAAAGRAGADSDGEVARGLSFAEGFRARVLAGQNQKRLKVAVLLSSGEQFSAYFGGALARWTYEVYRCLTERVQVQVFGFPTAPTDRYPMPHETSAVWRVCRVMEGVPFFRRYEEEVWLRALLGRLRKFEIIHIHNRPQWVPLLRRLDTGECCCCICRMI